MAKKAKSKGKICPEGKAWAKRTFDVYPSAYAKKAKGGKRKGRAQGGFVSIRGQGRVMANRRR
jgi:hypothetical protein